MKTKLSVLLAVAAILFTVQIGEAQTSVTLQSAGDSSWAGNCPTPATVYVYANGVANGYTNGDSVNIKYYYGDGTTDTQKTPIWTSWGNQFFGWNQHVYTAPGLYTFMAIATGPDGKSDTIVRAPGIAVTDTCGNIKGKVYVDYNSNCVFNPGIDSAIQGYQVYLAQGTSVLQWGWTDANGEYVFSAPTGIQYTVGLKTPSSPNFVYSCPASGVTTFTATSNSVNDFALTCSGSGFDLSTSINALAFRPRTQRVIWVSACNSSCTPVNGVLTVTLDPLLSYVNAAITPTSVIGNVITWNLNGLAGSPAYWNRNCFYTAITVLTDSTAQIGDTLCVSSVITPTVGDINTLNNVAYDCGPVVNSCDPNMKEVSPAGIGASGDIAPNTELTYTIHFQNTGNDVAYNVYILDTIDADLDLNTIKIISASHSMYTKLVSGNAIKFNFDNINLADSASNPTASMGYVTYTIKTKAGLANGTQINNTAHIFFDYNEAIVTNTTLNTISITLGIENNTEEKIYNVFPNPANDILNIKFDRNFSGQLSVIDMLGKEVIVKNFDSQLNITIDTSNLEKGVYFIRVNDNTTTAQRVVVIH